MADFWIGAFTREQAPNAKFANGTRIRKAKQEAGDATPLGTKGTVLGSISHPDVRNGAVLYFIEWDNRPKTAVGVIEWKLGPA